MTKTMKGLPVGQVDTSASHGLDTTKFKLKNREILVKSSQAHPGQTWEMADHTRRFSIVLEKGLKYVLGVDISALNDGGLLIINVNEGLMSDWNTANPDLAVKADDYIIAVNDIRGSCDALVAEITSACTLKILIASKAPGSLDQGDQLEPGFHMADEVKPPASTSPKLKKLTIQALAFHTASFKDTPSIKVPRWQPTKNFKLKNRKLNVAPRQSLTTSTSSGQVRASTGSLGLVEFSEEIAQQKFSSMDEAQADETTASTVSPCDADSA